MSGDRAFVRERPRRDIRIVPDIPRATYLVPLIALIVAAILVASVMSSVTGPDQRRDQERTRFELQPQDQTRNPQPGRE